jgi:peroxiredoxin
MKIRTWLIAFFVLVLAGVAVVFIRSLKPPETSPSSTLNALSSIPNLDIYTRDGRAVDLSKLDGKIIIVHFWATWCPPCVDEIPALSRFWAHYRDRKGIALYAVSVDDGWPTVDKFRQRIPFDFPVYMDPNAATAHKFGTTQFPETYVCNRNGRVLYHIANAVAWDTPKVYEIINSLLNG